jgi:hypothetical protein
LTEFDPIAGAKAALLDHLPKAAILARYQVAGGQELVSGKFANPESSAALAANAFGFFAEQPQALSLPGLVAAGEAQRVDLEVEMRFPWSGGHHPWLDVGVETKDRLIGIESKRYEPFRDRKAASFSAAYSRPVWGEAMGAYEAMRDSLTGGRDFVFLDAAQLVKHAFGLRTQAQATGRRAVLLYLFAEPPTYPDGRSVPQSAVDGHRAELAAFTAEVDDALADVAFCSLSYADLLGHWSGATALADHAAAIAAYFKVGSQ